MNCSNFRQVKGDGIELRRHGIRPQLLLSPTRKKSPSRILEALCEPGLLLPRVVGHVFHDGHRPRPCPRHDPPPSPSGHRPRQHSAHPMGLRHERDLRLHPHLHLGHNPGVSQAQVNFIFFPEASRDRNSLSVSR